MTDVSKMPGNAGTELWPYYPGINKELTPAQKAAQEDAVRARVMAALASGTATLDTIQARSRAAARAMMEAGHARQRAADALSWAMRKGSGSREARSARATLEACEAEEKRLTYEALVCAARVRVARAAVTAGR